LKKIKAICIKEDFQEDIGIESGSFKLVHVYEFEFGNVKWYGDPKKYEGQLCYGALGWIIPYELFHKTFRIIG